MIEFCQQELNSPVQGRKPRLLDCFCGDGGCSKGYSDAGFEVMGCDLTFRKRYPFPFIQADALHLLSCKDFVAQFDAIHASPPCQEFSVLRHLPTYKKGSHADLIVPVRELLLASGKPYIIENVPHAPLINPFTLCGTMFGLRTDCGAQLRRHRIFETNWFDDLLCMPQCQHGGEVISITGGVAENRAVPRTIGISGSGNAMTGIRAMKRDYALHGGRGHNRAQEQNTVRNLIRETFPIEQARKAMGIDWMTGQGLSQAIPPAYTKWIGERLQEFLANLDKTGEPVLE